MGCLFFFLTGGAVLAPLVVVSPVIALLVLGGIATALLFGIRAPLF